MDETAHKSSQNHELLIRVDEKLQILSRDVRDANTTFSSRISSLDNSKAEKTEVVRIEAELNKMFEDHEKRLRVVEANIERIMTMVKTWGTVLGVILGVLQIIQIIFAIAK